MNAALARSFDVSGIKLAESLLYTDNEHDKDVLDWLKTQQQAQKRSGQGTNPGSIDTGP